MAVQFNGATVKDVDPQEFVVALAAYLKKKMELPEWHDIVKTATYKEMPPQDPDWYFVRAASIARRVYLRGGIGVGALQKVYGGRHRLGSGRNRFALSSKGINRHIMKQLQELDILAQKEHRKGRFITKHGQRELDIIANQIAQKRQELLQQLQ